MWKLNVYDLVFNGAGKSFGTVPEWETKEGCILYEGKEEVKPPYVVIVDDSEKHCGRPHLTAYYKSRKVGGEKDHYQPTYGMLKDIRKELILNLPSYI